MKNLLPILTGLLAMLVAIGAKAQDSRAYAKEDVPLSHTLEAKTPTEAWEEVKKASEHFPPSPHTETSGNLTASDPRTKYIESWLIATADKAQEFYTKFPNDTNEATAKLKEINVLWEAIDETYATNQFPRLFKCANVVLRDTHFDKTTRFNMCNFIVMTAVGKKAQLPSQIDVATELRGAADIAEKDFRDLGDVRSLTWLAEDFKAEKTRPIFRELVVGLQKMADNPYTLGYVFRVLIEVTSLQRNAIGEPFTLQFTNFSGHAVNTAEMKGKVIAIDFWGTSYPESINNVLHLEKLYQKFHSKGLEIIGVNVDRDSETLKKFVSEHKVEWPQYWDGKETDNKIAQPNHVIRAGTILLIDKKGILRDINGDEDMDKKIEALLNE